ncbi:MAG TPA: magnesium/cobalt transporter CorA [Xanthobacteraceae bacterium]|jgi:magnesium transporter
MNEVHESAPPRPGADVAQGMVVNCAAYQGGCRVAEIDLEQARKLDTSDGRFVWIGLHEPDQPLLRTVQQRFGLHDLAIEDALRAHQRPKLEIYGDTLFIVVRTALLQDRKLRCGETHIFAGRGYVVTVRHGSTTAYKEVRARCEGAPKMLAMGEGFVVYSIMDFIVDNYFPIIQEFESEVDSLEDAIFSRTSDRPNVERIYEVRHELLLLRRAVQPLQEMCNRMMRFDVPVIDQAMHPYFRDIQDHVIRLVESIDNLRDLLAAALEAHLLLSSVEQNNIIKIFSVAAVVLMPPTLIASIYGMNFKSMPELEWPYGYSVALALMVMVGVLPYLFFKWKKWL